MTGERLWAWWEAFSVLDPLNWAAIALVLFAISARRHTKTYGAFTLPNKEEIADLFLSVGTIYGAFNVIYVLLSRRPIADLKSGVFYLLAALIGAVVETSAKLPIGLNVAPVRPPRKRKPFPVSPVPVPVPQPTTQQLDPAGRPSPGT